MKIYNLFSLGIVLVGLIFLNGCQTAHYAAGSGPLTLSIKSKAGLEAYLSDERASYFAVSIDGETYGYSICPAGSYNCVETPAVALRSCHSNSRGVPCKLYANRRTIVWSGLKETGRKKIQKETPVGRGHLTLSSKVEKYFDSYLDKLSPQYFAVSQSGRYAGWSSCLKTPCDNTGYAQAAISYCENLSEKFSGKENCYIYAKGRKVVWKDSATD